MTTNDRPIARSDDHYTPIAANYTTSAVHAQGADLARMVEVDAQLQRDLVQLRQRLYNR